MPERWALCGLTVLGEFSDHRAVETGTYRDHGSLYAETVQKQPYVQSEEAEE